MEVSMEGSEKKNKFSLVKLISRYDYVIFDCEFDLKYLHQLVDIPLVSSVYHFQCRCRIQTSIVSHSRMSSTTNKGAGRIHVQTKRRFGADRANRRYAFLCAVFPGQIHILLDRDVF